MWGRKVDVNVSKQILTIQGRKHTWRLDHRQIASQYLILPAHDSTLPMRRVFHVHRWHRWDLGFWTLGNGGSDRGDLYTEDVW